MIRLTCKERGLNCNFSTEGENVTNVVAVFRNHTALEHGVRYEKEALMQFIIGMNSYCPYCNSKFENKELLSQHIDRIHHGMGILEGNSREFV